MPLLRVQNLKKSFAGRTVVNGVSFHVAPGEIVGLLGRNGAGKTTSFRMTIGMIEPDEGEVFFKNENISTLPMYLRARLGMGYLSQEPSVFQRLTCEQNLLAILETIPGMRRRDRKRRAAELLEQFGLTKKANHHARTCSGGERRKLEIARALVTEPSLILLDEPFSGVDPIAVEDLQREIQQLSQRGIACLVTDHNVQQTLRVCHRAYIIDNGRKFAEGTPRELINDEMVKRVYLGSLFRGDEFDDVEPPPPRTPATPVAPSAPVRREPAVTVAAAVNGNGHGNGVHHAHTGTNGAGSPGRRLTTPAPAAAAPLRRIINGNGAAAGGEQPPPRRQP